MAIARDTVNINSNESVFRLGDVAVVAVVMLLAGGTALATVTQPDGIDRRLVLPLAVTVLAGLGTVGGMITFARQRNHVLLWLCNGIEVGFATDFVGLGFGAFFVAVATVVWTLRTAKRLNVPAIDKSGWVAEAIGFGAIMLWFSGMLG